MAEGQPAAARTMMLFVLSVGGGSLEKNISPNLVVALKMLRHVGATIVGVVGRDGGYTARSPTPASSCRPSIRTP